MARLRHRRRIVGLDGDALLEEATDHLDGGRAAQVVGVRLEREAQDADDRAIAVRDAVPQDLESPLTLCAIDVDHGIEDAGLATDLGRRRRKGAHVLGKARAAPADPGLEEGGPDPRVRADDPLDLADVGSHGLADAGHLVHERHLGREEGVRRVLGHLGRPAAGQDDGRLEAGVQLGDPRRDVGRPGADDDPVRVHEVVHGGPFTQELRVRCDVDTDAGGLGKVFDLVARPDRHGRLGDDHETRAGVLEDGPDGGFDEGGVGAAIGARWRVHRQDDEVRTRDRRRVIVGELQSTLRPLAGDEIIESRLVDRQAAGQDPVEARSVDLEGHDGVAETGQASAGDQPDVTGADDGDSGHGPPVFDRRRTGGPRSTRSVDWQCPETTGRGARSAPPRRCRDPAAPRVGLGSVMHSMVHAPHIGPQRA